MHACSRPAGFFANAQNDKQGIATVQNYRLALISYVPPDVVITSTVCVAGTFTAASLAPLAMIGFPASTVRNNGFGFAAVVRFAAVGAWLSHSTLQYDDNQMRTPVDPTGVPLSRASDAALQYRPEYLTAEGAEIARKTARQRVLIDT